MTFRLLQLPYLVFSEIINQLKPNELVILSLCSQKLRSLVKRHRNKSQNGPVFIYGRSQSWSGVNSKKKTEKCWLLGARSDVDITLKTVSIGEFHEIPYFIQRSTGALITCWKDPTEGSKVITNYIFDLLNINEIEIFEFSWSNLWWFDWLNERGIEIQITESSSREKDLTIQTEQFFQIFRKCKSQNMKLLNAPEQGFRYEGTFHPYEHAFFKFGFWVTIQNLKSMDFMYFFLLRSKLNSLDINQFLKHWLEMGNPRLKFWNIELHGLFVFDEIDAEIRDRLQFVRDERKYNFTEDLLLTTSYDLRRDEDGVLLTLFWRQINTGNDEVWIMNWPDDMGRTHRQNVQGIEGN